MSKTHSVERKDKEAIRKVSHPAIGEIYCLNEPEARATLHEVWVDKVYFQEGISISPDDIVFDVGANIGVFTLCAAKHRLDIRGALTEHNHRRSMRDGPIPHPAGCFVRFV